jgi:hypothetical protein
MPMAATHKSVLTMGDGHSCSRRTEGPLPRAIIYDLSVPGMARVKCGWVTSAPDYLVFYLPGQSGTAPASALLSLGRSGAVQHSTCPDILHFRCISF